MWCVTVHFCPFAIDLQLSPCASHTTFPSPISSLPSSVNSFATLLPSHTPILHITVLLPFLVHFPQILVPAFTLCIAFPFPFAPVSRHSILLLLKAGSWFLSQPGHLFCSLAQSGSGEILLSLPTDPALSITRCPHMQRCFWAPLGSGFPKAEPSPLPCSRQPRPRTLPSNSAT